MSAQDDFLEALRKGDGEVIGPLLDAAPELLQAEASGTSPILLAIYHGHGHLASLFTSRGRTLTIHEAAAVGDDSRVHTLVEGDRSLVEALSSDGFPPLSLAIFFRHPALARYLLEQGAPVDLASRNPQQVAPLHAATAVGDIANAELLLTRGADPNARQQNDFTPLHGAASNGNRPLAELLLRHGADRNARSADGKSAAELARDRGFAELAELLSTE